MPELATASRKMGIREWGLLLTLSVIWGGSFLFVEVALRELPPFTIVLGRVAIAALTLVVLVYATGCRLPAQARQWSGFIVLGALNNLVPFSLTVWGQTQIAGGLAAILIATTPFLTVVLAHFLTADERMSLMALTGTLFGLAGVTVVIGIEALSGLSLAIFAELAVLGAALCYACGGIFGRRFKDTPPLVTAAGQTTVAAVVLAPLVLVLDRPWLLPMPSVTAWGAIAGLALLSTALAFVIYFRVLATAGATNVLLVTFLVPVSAILLGATILGESLDLEHFAGTVLIGLGLAAVDGRPVYLLRRASRGALH